VTPAGNANDSLRGDVARARASAIGGIAVGIIGIAVAIGFFVIAAGFDPPWLRDAREFVAGLGLLALLFGAWSLVDHVPRARILGRLLAHPAELAAAEPATLRRQPAARLRLADGRTVVIPTTERLRKGGAEG
jgi:hypothetical protein